jgi:hypothetical protein
MGRDGIFISYRRADVAFHADWLHSHLVRSFGAARVLRDLDSIALGADYPHAIDRALESCSHLVAVIGPRWVDLMREGVRGPGRS